VYSRSTRRRIVISATFTADPLDAVLSYWTDQLGYDAAIEVLPFHQVFQHLLDVGGPLLRDRSAIGIVLFRLEDWQHDVTGELVAAVRTAARAGVTLLVVRCPPATPPNGGVESIASPALPGEAAPPFGGAESIDRELAALAAERPGVVFVSPAELLANAPATYLDPRGDHTAKIPYTPELYAALATLLARKIHAIIDRPYKVVALDCDGTLWSGVLGEDGPEGIRIDVELQRELIRLHDQGMLLCLCSKNEDDDVWAVFEHHPEMLLRPEHIVARRVNWNRKSESLRELADELDLALDTFIFIDDNALECAEVAARYPEVLVLEARPQLIERTWAFDRLRVTAEDRTRTQMYAQEAQRKQARGTSASLDEFLAQLELVVETTALAPNQYGRASDLSKRTTQFNTTGKRLIESELGAMHVRVTTARDRFGDYGLVGLSQYAVEGERLVVELMLLSCRALGKGIEHRMVRELAEVADTLGATAIELAFTPTARNQPARRFLDAIGHVLTVAEAAACAPKPTVEQEPEAETPRAAPDDRAARRVKLLQRTAHELATPEAVLASVRAARRPVRTTAAWSAPETATERLVAELWAVELGAERVGRHDNFFDLGGNSVHAVLVLNRIGDRLELDLPITSILERPVLSELAAQIGQVDRSASKIVRSGATSGPTVQVQRYFEKLNETHPEATFAREYVSWRVTGPVDANALERAMHVVVQRHEILRTQFEREGTTVRQHVGSRLPALERERVAEILPAVIPFIDRTFDLQRGEVMRAKLFELAEQDHVLITAMHHVAYDFASWSLYATELATGYRMMLGGASADDVGSALVELPFQFLDVATRLSAFVESPAGAHALEFWRTRLAGAEPVILPVDFPRDAVDAARAEAQRRGPIKTHVDQYTAIFPAGCVTVSTDAAFVSTAMRFVERERVTPLAYLLAGLAALLHGETGQTDLAFNTNVGTRPVLRAEPLIGPFHSPTFVRVDLASCASYRELLHAYRDGVVDMLRYATVPVLESVEHHVGRLGFGFFGMNAPRPSLALGDARTELLPPWPNRRDTHFDFWPMLDLRDEHLTVHFIYNQLLFRSATVERLAAKYLELLRSIAAAPDARVLVR
jgi:FkbH-like protein